MDSLPETETQSQTLQAIFGEFFIESRELHALLDTARLAFNALELAEAEGLGQVLFMATNRAQALQAALKIIADHQEANNE